VAFAALNSEARAPYALGRIGDREAVILFNRETRQTAERTIEYFL
jgi:hypothetical protein